MNDFANREKKTFVLHFSYAVIEGIISGVIVLNEFVFIKSLGGSDYLLSVLFQFSMLVFILLIFVNEFIRRSARKRRLLRITGVVTRLPLILMALFPHSPAVNALSFHYLFLAVFLFYYLGNIIIFPMINLLLKSNYTHARFGKYYSYSTAAGKISMLAATYFYGTLLDTDFYAFTYVYPFIAFLGILSVVLLSLIDLKEPSGPVIRSAFMESVKGSMRNMVNILKSNRPYLHFEISFMLYGFAFMTTYSVVILFMEKELHLGYNDIAFYKNLHLFLSIVFLPVMGRYIGRTLPQRFAIVTYLFLLMYIVFIMITGFFPARFEFAGLQIYPFLFIAFLFYGFFASTMGILWNIGSAYFCESEQVWEYQSVHLFLTGLRATFAPVLGVFFLEMSGYTVTFLIASIVLLAAIGVMLVSYRSVKKG